MAPNENEDARFPGTAMLLRMAAAFVPAPERDFESVEIVDVRLSTILLNLYFCRQRQM